MFVVLIWDELTRFISLKSPQKNQGRPVLTLATLWTPVGQVMTINWDLRSPTTATMATQQWAGKPSPVSWGMMGSLCGTRLCHLVKVGETHKELHAYRSMHIVEWTMSPLMWTLYHYIAVLHQLLLFAQQYTYGCIYTFTAMSPKCNICKLCKFWNMKNGKNEQWPRSVYSVYIVVYK